MTVKEVLTDVDGALELKLSKARGRPTLSWVDALGSHQLKVEGRVLMGSSEQVPCRIADRLVSRVHAELTLGDDGVWVRDLSSTNGTWVGDVRVVQARIPGGGAFVTLGQTRVEVSFDAQPGQVMLWPKEHMGQLVGRAPATRELFMRLAETANSEAAVLIQGETGTGKELVAQAVHQRSRRAKGPFVIVDCGAIAESLFESELFGHLKGAFTGAVGPRVGALESANGGTVFLDEVGEVPLGLQPRLLRALETKTVRRLGDNAYQDIDVRFVAATHRDLESMVANGTFREDLYFRLAVLPLKVPALRERPEDVAPLLAHFLGSAAPALPPTMLRELECMPWPGNVRELRTFAERALAVGPLRALEMLKGREAPAPVAVAMPVTGGAGLPHVDIGVPFKLLRETWVDFLEREYIGQLIARHGRSVTSIAQAAGLDRTYVHRLLKKHLL